MKENYNILTVLSKNEDGTITARVPDFNQITYADSEDTIISNVQELISLCIIDMEQRGEKIPEYSDISNISLEINEKVVFVHIWMPYFRTATKEVYVKKTLTIPKWLDMLAKESDVNFSAALVKGIKIELGMDIR